MSDNKTRIRWAVSWSAMVGALALHVADEALTGFLPFYNSIVESLRDRYAWQPFPTFTFEVWLAGLVILVIALFALTPLALRGSKVLLGLSYFFGVLMVANATAHVVASFWLGKFAPGVYSSPVLLVTAIALLYTATAASRQER